MLGRSISFCGLAYVKPHSLITQRVEQLSACTAHRFIDGKKSVSHSPILIGQCGGAWGLQGSIKIISWSMPRENILSYHPWYLSDKPESSVQLEDLIAHEIINPKVLRAGRSIATQFKGIEHIDAVLPLQGKYIYILPEQLSNHQDEYYWHDLIGMAVINQHNESLGEVTDMLTTGVHDVLKIKCNPSKPTDKPQEATYYRIPFVREQYILSVDREQKIIQVNWDADWL